MKNYEKCVQIPLSVKVNGITKEYRKVCEELIEVNPTNKELKPYLFMCQHGKIEVVYNGIINKGMQKAINNQTLLCLELPLDISAREVIHLIFNNASAFQEIFDGLTIVDGKGVLASNAMYTLSRLSKIIYGIGK